MSDERIDIEVTDKIDGNVEKKLRGIADGADKGATAVERLKSQLASITDTPVTRLKSAMEGANASISKALGAQSTLGKAAAETSAADLKAASDKAKVTAAIDQEASATSRLSKTIEQSVAAYEAQRKASLDAYNAKIAQGPVYAGSRSAAAAATAQMAGMGSGPSSPGNAAQIIAEANAVKAASSTAATAVNAASSETVGAFGRMRAAAMGAFDTVRDGMATVGGKFKGFFAPGAAQQVQGEGQMLSNVANKGIAVGGVMRELMVIGREGMRGDFTRMAGSVSLLLMYLGMMGSVLVPLVVIVGSAAAVFKLFSMSISSDVNPRLKDYANSLGLTSKEMRKLQNETVDAHHKLKEFDVTVVTMGDTFHGFVATVGEGLSTFRQTAQQHFGQVGISWGTLWTNAKSFLYMAIVGFYGLVKGFVAWAVATIANCIKIIANVGMAIASVAAQALVGIINAGVTALNWLSQKSNSIFGTTFGLMEKWHADAPQYFNLSGVNIAETVNGGVREADATLQAFGKRWKANTEEAAKERIKGLADAIKGNRNPKKPHHTPDPKTKEDFLDDTNQKLDLEISRMRMLKDAREEQQRLDQIQEEFQRRRMPLTAAELAGFKAKIHAISEYKYIQSELDRIYEEGISPQRSYNATVQATTELLGQNAISAARAAYEVSAASRKLGESKDLIGANGALRTYQEALDKIKFSVAEKGISEAQAAQETVKAKRAYEQAVNPLFALNEEVDKAARLTGLYGDALERANYYDQVREAFLQKGIVLQPQYVAGLNAEVDALMKKNEALAKGQYIQSQLSGIIGPISDEAKMLQNKQGMYDALDALRSTDLKKEGDYQRAKYALDAKFSQMRLAGASAFFGELAGLSSSGNKKLAAIGKAAAVAQATIDGFVAVQKALASAPPPWNFAIAGAVALKTGAQVAGILSTNVGNFRDGGDFIVQGNAGVDQNRIAMNVSRGERVKIETPEQQRRAANGGGSGPVNVGVKIVNVHDKEEIINHMSSDEGERVILNVIRNNPGVVAQTVQARG